MNSSTKIVNPNFISAAESPNNFKFVPQQLTSDEDTSHYPEGQHTDESESHNNSSFKFLVIPVVASMVALLMCISAGTPWATSKTSPNVEMSLFSSCSCDSYGNTAGFCPGHASLASADAAFTIAACIFGGFATFVAAIRPSVARLNQDGWPRYMVFALLCCTITCTFLSWILALVLYETPQCGMRLADEPGFSVGAQGPLAFVACAVAIVALVAELYDDDVRAGVKEAFGMSCLGCHLSSDSVQEPTNPQQQQQQSPQGRVANAPMSNYEIEHQIEHLQAKLAVQKEQQRNQRQQRQQQQLLQQQQQQELLQQQQQKEQMLQQQKQKEQMLREQQQKEQLLQQQKQKEQLLQQQQQQQPLMAMCQQDKPQKQKHKPKQHQQQQQQLPDGIYPA